MSWAELPTDLQQTAARALTVDQLAAIKLQADGVSQRSSARRLNISRSTLRSRLEAAHDRLAKALTQETQQ